MMRLVMPLAVAALAAGSAIETMAQALNVEQCLSLQMQGITQIQRTREAANIAWRVQLANRCPEGGTITVEFWALDRQNQPVAYDKRDVQVPPGAPFEARGIVQVAPGQVANSIVSTVTRYGPSE
jgi:hypothetical protein